MAMPTTEGLRNAAAPELSELEDAATVELPVTAGRDRIWVGWAGLALALQGWLSGKPISKRDRARSTALDAEHNWANYW
jgi:hypothetical protein